MKKKVFKKHANASIGEMFPSENTVSVFSGPVYWKKDASSKLLKVKSITDENLC